ncbi:hypothetical protein LEP1GSC013_2452 [Leptospira interrogans serovar Valbuzzi str. Duyster]|nr:hypothetical protein LEP1GSC013_2452 [Leptospira interrogans serovar Valbuzzi str. Duyster]ENO73155.1 hypothetical protein LEP1GSC012_3272 [Leptospira interrogans serovar Valbuzzi str. Valbuzzi]
MFLNEPGFENSNTNTIRVCPKTPKFFLHNHFLEIYNQMQ